MIRRGRMKITPELIRDALHMPADHEIDEASWDFDWQMVVFYISGPDMPVVEKEQDIQELSPIITRKEDPETGETTFAWDWGVTDALRATTGSKR